MFTRTSCILPVFLAVGSLGRADDHPIRPSAQLLIIRQASVPPAMRTPKGGPDAETPRMPPSGSDQGSARKNEDAEAKRWRCREYELTGHILFRDRRYNEAFVQFNEAVELNPSDPELLYSRGTTLGWMGLYDDAIADLTEAIRLKPDFKEARIGLSSSIAWRNYYLSKR